LWGNYYDKIDNVFVWISPVRPIETTSREKNTSNRKASSLKRTIAYWLRSKKKTMQRKEAFTCVIAYSVVRDVI